MHKKAFIIIGILVLVLFGRAIIATLKFTPFFFQLIFNNKIEIKKFDKNINILLLGIGGEKHDGPDLSDTMIFASIDQSKNKVTLVSLPRDLWIPDLGGKINLAYADGESKRKGGGLTEAKAAAGKILGQPIDYGIRINFAGFVKAVDILGGLAVAVDNAFGCDRI